MSKSLIIVPTYNERDNIDLLLKEIFTSQPKVNVLFVDDNSQDGTKDKIRAWQTKMGQSVRLIERPGKMGLGSAYVTGFKFALAEGFDNIIEMDADLSHNPKYLVKMFATLKESDVAIGSRNIPGGGTKNWGFVRKLISRFGSFYAGVILGTPAKDLTGGFNGWRREVLEAIDLEAIKSEGYAFQIELKHRAYKQGFSILEFPIIFEDRRVGQSKMSSGIVFEALYRVWQIRFSV